jgi:hypothetical protein
VSIGTISGRQALFGLSSRNGEQKMIKINKEYFSKSILLDRLNILVISF